ncbi:MAG: cyclic nucleotide-binding domain-containing protein [Solirubrobacterales bacterium]|nr:cyclic nucleotide-binding domain-containing protein [Solirubrobacterales bacterium]
MDASRIAAIPIFAGLPEPELAAVASVAFEVEVPSGEAVANEGDFGHALFAIESGTADIVMGDTTLRSVGMGDVVGEIAVLGSGRRTASIMATSPLRLIALFKRDVWALDNKAPLAAQRLRAALDEHRAMDEHRSADT